ncbi:hypothetical protein MsAg5_02490 [Methanosarcinaceae archaeon Ag5]|uniref:Uncharacterized protein n=1 Tax=Methanolapillus africanus TaxID=3028297 RepID=A0AAE4MI35_9EURY|nr:hypothetical protein [Methanosarcinaceae archaeon Ag5]
MTKTGKEIRETAETYQVDDDLDETVMSDELVDQIINCIKNMSEEEFDRIMDECGNNDDNVPTGPLFMSRADYERTKDMTPEEAVKALGW